MNTNKTNKGDDRPACAAADRQDACPTEILSQPMIVAAGKGDYNMKTVMMKIVMTLLLVLLAGIYSSAAANVADKIAYINLHVIVAESDMGKQAREEFNKIRAGMEDEIKEKIKEIELLNATLQREREKNPVDEKGIALVIDKLQQKNKEYERLTADTKEELAKKDKELVIQILEKVAPILTELAESRGYAVIFKNAVDFAYVAPAADITKEVIERLNKVKTEKGKKKLSDDKQDIP